MEEQIENIPDEAGILGLGAVKIGSLPPTLMTDEAPQRYTVDIMFTRRPVSDEIAAITDPSTRDFLVAAGYPHVALDVVDRRLEVSGTNLVELRDGLATMLGERLTTIGGALRGERKMAREQALRDSDAQAHRLHLVKDLAEQVSFKLLTGVHQAALEQEEQEEENWENEGGATP
ncbi:hypothetical protein [Rothia uropygialis]|uniref:hypothetical protein n=1 Tax=Kocuria sp. 36 TaxID=1415402 RepID=UPI00101D2E09|nr:hypothetical protein [Kocuria sp. 36]